MDNLNKNRAVSREFPQEDTAPAEGKGYFSPSSFLVFHLPLIK